MRFQLFILFLAFCCAIAEPERNIESMLIPPSRWSNMSINESSKSRSRRSRYRVPLKKYPIGPLFTEMKLSGIEGFFNVLIDTASQATWFASTWFSDRQNVELLTSYPTPEEMDTYFYEKYKGHNLLGQTASHTIKLGDLYVTGFTVGVVHQMDPVLPFIGLYGGVLGSAPFYGPPIYSSSFCFWLVETQPSGERFFTLWFPPASDGVAELVIGHLNESRMTQPMTWLQLKTQHLWSFEVEKILLGECVLCENNCEVVLDSGTAFGYGDPDRMAAVAPNFKSFGQPKMGLYIIDCNSLHEGPHLVLHFTNQIIMWKREAFTVIADYKGGQRCYFGFRPAGEAVPGRWTFGQYLMRSLYTVYDIETQTVGLARARLPT